MQASIYPGQPAHAVFWAKFFVLLLVAPPLGLLIVPAIAWCIWRSRYWLFLPQVCPKWLAIAAPMISGIMLGLVQFNIPQTLAFRMSQNAFEQALDNVPTSVTQVDTRIGLYNVERYGADPRGGTYFRLRWEDVGLDLVHYGFVYQPNQQGSPFGEIDYTLQPLTGDWYVFSDISPFRL